MFGSNGGSMSQGTSNGTVSNAVGADINEPWWFTQTLGIFGSKIINAI